MTDFVGRGFIFMFALTFVLVVVEEGY